MVIFIDSLKNINYSFYLANYIKQDFVEAIKTHITAILTYGSFGVCKL
jgi:hypothetical protein